MINNFSASAPSSVELLFHPSLVPVLDVFRSISRFDDHYDLALLDEPERALKVYTQPTIAKAIVSDALLLAFALSRQRERPLRHRAVGSRHGSRDEYCLMSLVGSLRTPSSDLMSEAAAALDIVSLDFISALATELVQQIRLGALVFEVPSVDEFRAVIGKAAYQDPLVAPINQASFHFQL